MARKEVPTANYCYFCSKEIEANEKINRLKLYTWVNGEKEELVCHKDCIEGDFRKGEE